MEWLRPRPYLNYHHVANSSSSMRCTWAGRLPLRHHLLPCSGSYIEGVHVMRGASQADARGCVGTKKATRSGNSWWWAQGQSLPIVPDAAGLGLGDDSPGLDEEPSSAVAPPVHNGKWV